MTSWRICFVPLCPNFFFKSSLRSIPRSTKKTRRRQASARGQNSKKPWKNELNFGFFNLRNFLHAFFDQKALFITCFNHTYRLKIKLDGLSASRFVQSLDTYRTICHAIFHPILLIRLHTDIISIFGRPNDLRFNHLLHTLKSYGSARSLI